jgi:hypothetical protein
MWWIVAWLASQGHGCLEPTSEVLSQVVVRTGAVVPTGYSLPGGVCKEVTAGLPVLAGRVCSEATVWWPERWPRCTWRW